MPVTTTYPGIYIEEMPSTSHSVAPAPTSVTAFVGWAHPLKTDPSKYGTAVQIFSFSDYVANFGGFFNHPLLPDYMGQAVFQFFANGGSTAWIVGLESDYYSPPAGAAAEWTLEGPVAGATVSVPDGAGGAQAGLVFTAREPTALTPGQAPGIDMSLTINNMRKVTNPDDTADIVIVYGTTVETYRQVPVGHVADRLAGSSLVSVTQTGAPGAFPSAGFSDTLKYPNVGTGATAQPPPATWSVINPAKIGDVFAANSSLDKVDVLNLVALPGISGAGAVAALSDALAFCERKLAFLIVDPPAYAVADSTETSDATAVQLATQADMLGSGTAKPDTIDTFMRIDNDFPNAPNAALYFPWVQTIDPTTGLATQSPPSGFVAGMMAKEDNARGVWKSPAGLETVLNGTTGVVPWGRMTDAQQGPLNKAGINCLRQLPGIGTVIFGARTLVAANPAYEQYRYVSVRRMALFIEQSLKAGLAWAVFEPNAEPLWTALRLEVQAFMLSLFQQGAFPGSTPATSFQVQCDASTTTPQDVATGVVNLVVAFAPLRPAEFVVLRIAQLAGQG